MQIPLPQNICASRWMAETAKKAERRSSVEIQMEVNEVQEQMKAVQRMQEYIEEHLEEDITLANLSEVSLFSS